MNIYLFFIIFISLIGIKIYIKDFNKDYLDKKNSSCIKGIFILIVFASHIRQYSSFYNKTDLMMINVLDTLGQLMVTMFLFYSGYGIFESIKNKKQNYINSIPKKRILNTLINFDICVLIYFIIFTIINKTFSLNKFLFSLIAWDGYGNSNWYIFCILGLYLITYITYKIFDYNQKKGIVSIWIFTLIFYIFLSKYKDYYWYNTLFCYPLGITYSYFKNNINRVLLKNNVIYHIILIVLLVSNFALFNYIDDIVCYDIMSCIFVLLMVVISVKVKFNSKILLWFGDNLFWVYILQRIPMIVLTNLNYFAYGRHRAKLFILSFAFTVLLTFIFKYLTNLIKLQKRLFTK